LLAGNGLALVKTIDFISAHESLHSHWFYVSAAVGIPVIGLVSAYRMLLMMRPYAAELTALIAIVLQLSIWVAFTANLIGPQ
jgi:hypothetical protein